MTPDLLKSLRKYAFYVGAAALLLLGAFAVGRFTVPSKVETKVETHETVVTKVDDTKLDQLIEQNHQFQSQLSELKKSIHKERWAVTHADGSKEEKDTEDINIDRTVQTTQIQYVDRVETHTETKYIDRVVDRIVEKEKTITNEKPKWEVGALAGLQLPDLGHPATWLKSPVLVGAEVTYRVVGSFKVGLGALTNLNFTTGILVGKAALEF